MATDSNIIEFIKSKFNVEDIQGKLTATQSSFSKWSKDNEPTSLLSDSSHEFANHTSMEKNPWIIISSEEIIAPQFLVIQNRKNDRFADIAAGLKVECSIDGQSYKTLHQGLSYFGSCPDDYPLVLPLKGRENMRHIKISLESETETKLHLSRINILQTPPKDVPLFNKNNTLTFLACRSDGLGERLRAILNAIYFSENLSCSYRIVWPLRGGMDTNEFHHITTAEELFCQSYINEFFIEEKTLASKKVYDLDKKGPISLATLSNLSETGIDYFKVQQSTPNKYIKNKLGNKSDFRKSFSEIRFSKKINEVIDYINSMPFKKETVAIHVRGGDIIYGEYRLNQLYNQKLIPISYAIAIAEKIKLQGRDVIVFLQDKNLIPFLSSYEIQVADELIKKSWSNLQKTFFEMYLMSKCKEIIRGTSGFASLASKIGNSRIGSVDSYLNHDEKLLSLKKIIFKSKVDKMQKAFACNTYLLLNKKYEDAESTEQFLTYAVENDPSNLLYQVKRVYNFISNDKLDEAEKLCDKIFKANETGQADSNFLVMNFVKPFGKNDMILYSERILNCDVRNYSLLNIVKNCILNNKSVFTS